MIDYQAVAMTEKPEYPKSPTGHSPHAYVQRRLVTATETETACGDSEGRYKIFQCWVGSHLYGTNTETSDEDFGGIFSPSLKDSLQFAQPMKKEIDISSKLSTTARNQHGDTDSKLYSLHQFFKLATEGQPAQFEYFFVPPELILHSTPVWDEIVAHRHLFLGKSAVRPFVGFATKQARKAILKGERLADLRQVQQVISKIQQSDPTTGHPRRLRDLFTYTIQPTATDTYLHDPIQGVAEVPFEGLTLRIVQNRFGFDLLELPNGAFVDLGTTVKDLRVTVERHIGQYGSRSEKSAERGFDPKSLSHAFRLVYEVAEFLETGFITLPRPAEERVVLKTLKSSGTLDEGQISSLFESLEANLAGLRQLEEDSTLPNNPDEAGIYDLYLDVHTKLVRQNLLTTGD